MKQKRIILLTNTFCLILLFLLAGCDYSKQIPDPPHAEAALVIELLSALDNNDYQLAKKKLTRLKAIDSDEIYIESIRVRIENNLLISKAQKLLDSGDIDKAIDTLNQKISVEGESSALVAAFNQLETLKEIKQLTDNVLNAESAKNLAVNSGKLNRAISSYTSAKALSSFSSLKLDHARSLLITEKALAVEDLKAGIDIAWVQNRPYLDTMIASLEVEDPTNPEVLAYKKAMQENWMDEKVSEIQYEPEKEFIFFRKGLLLQNDAARENIYSVLMYLPPNSYRSLLIKALLLKFAGYSKESSAITKQVTEATSASSSKVKQWFQLKPEKLIEINKINPFVLHPFFIYFEGVPFNK